MKHRLPLLSLLGLLLLATGAAAEPLGIGSSIRGFELQDQFGRHHSITKMPRTLILTFGKKTGAFVNGFLTRQGSEYLAIHDALYIADIARMPSFITTMFALPKMKSYTHTVLLAYRKDFQKQFQVRKGKATIIHFDSSSKISEILFAETEAQLEREILR